MQWQSCSERLDRRLGERFYGGSGGGGTSTNPPIYQLQNMPGADINAQQGITNLQNNTQLQQLYNQSQNALGGIDSQASGYSPQQVVQTGYNIEGAAAGLPQQATNVYAAAQGIPGMASNVDAASQGLPYMAQQIYNTGFDPQNALFNQLQQQVADQTGALEAQQGMAQSPFAAGLESQNLSNFDIGWQNNLLNRETQAGQSANQLLQGYAGDESTAAGMIGQYAQDQTAGAGLDQIYGQMMAQGADVMAQAPQMQMMVGTDLGQMANNVLNQNQTAIGDWLQYLGIGNQAEGVALQSQQIANQASQAAGQQNMQAAGMGMSALGSMK